MLCLQLLICIREEKGSILSEWRMWIFIPFYIHLNLPPGNENIRKNITINDAPTPRVSNRTGMSAVERCSK
jgi:hypothetical protein